MAKRSKKRRDEAAEEADRLTSIVVSGYAEVVIVTEDDEDPKTRTALIVNGVPHIEIEGRDIVDVLRKFADALDAAREGIES